MIKEDGENRPLSLFLYKISMMLSGSFVTKAKRDDIIDENNEKGGFCDVISF